MEPRSRPIPWLANCTALCAVLLPGCVLPESLLVVPKDTPPVGQVRQVVVTWNKEVVFTQDPANGGTSRPSIAGRLYLFGPQLDFPLAGDGQLTIDLCVRDAPAPTALPGAAGSSPAPPTPAAASQYHLVEQWRFDRDTLKRLLRKDTIGWGYTLLLPWGTCKSDTTQVHLKVRYDTGAGLPIYADSGPLTLTVPKGQ